MLLVIRAEHLNQQNLALIGRLDQATAALVNHELLTIDQQGASLAASGRLSLIFLISVAALGLSGLIVFFYLHVQRHLVRRLGELSEGMQMIATGRYDIALPSQRSDELGRLGRAVHQFHKVTLEASRREAELQRLNKRLEQLSISDPLTGMPNRRRFDQVLPNEWARAARAGKSIAVLMIDVDWFKAYNDLYGHQKGDVCLKMIASAMMDELKRPTDLASRYGGEEFTVVLTDCTIDGALHVAARIRQAVEAMHIPHKGSDYGVVTVSIGAAAAKPSSDSDAELIVRQADQALYRAKSAGRNTIIDY